MNTSNEFKRSRMWSRPRVVARRMLLAWPLLVWAFAVLVVFYLQSDVVQYGNLTGVVDAEEQSVAPPDMARLMSLEVQLGQQVKAGDVLARMDTALLDAEMAAEAAAAIEAEETLSRYQASILGMSRQFEAAVMDARADLAGDRLGQMQAEAELAELNKELLRRQGLFQQRLIREEDVTILLPQIAALGKAIEAYPELIEIRRQALDSVKAQLVDMYKWIRIGEGESISDAIMRKSEIREAATMAQAKARMIERDAYVLRAARDGEVSRIYHLPGDIIPGGEPVLRVTRPDSTHVVGFLGETQLLSARTGMPVTVWRQGKGTVQHPGVIDSVAPDVEALPDLVSPLRGQTIRGRRIMIRLHSGHDLLPGEKVQIASSTPSWVRWVRRGVDWFGVKNGTGE